MLCRNEYNNERPHEALGQRPPVRMYQASQRPYPERITDVDDPGHYEVRKVCSAGKITWKNQAIFIGFPLAGERIGLREIEDGLWRVYFADVELGVLDEVQLKDRRIGRVLPMCPV